MNNDKSGAETLKVLAPLIYIKDIKKQMVILPSVSSNMIFMLYLR